MEYKRYVISWKVNSGELHFLHLQNLRHFSSQRSGIIGDQSLYVQVLSSLSLSDSYSARKSQHRLTNNR
jgi:hypothetical protein